jgi:hypothetical protein
VPPEPVSGLYDRLVTEELRRLLAGLESGRVDVVRPDAADTHLSVAEPDDFFREAKVAAG